MNKPRVHDLKIWPPFFADLVSDRKGWELRINDRGYSLGDHLILREWDPITKKFTGRRTFAIVADMLPARVQRGKPVALKLWGIPEGWGP